mgnify:CR=1 FL=1
MTKGVSRPRFEAGGYLTAADCQLEQSYRMERVRRHDRQLHGYGVVCGLWVVPLADPARPWGVRVCPGYAVGPYGDEMQVPEAAIVNLHDFLWARIGSSFVSGSTGSGSVSVNRRRVIYVAMRAVDRPDRLVAAPSAECGCLEPVYRESRIADDYEFAGVWTPPAAGRPRPASPPTPSPPSPSCRCLRPTIRACWLCLRAPALRPAQRGRQADLLHAQGQRHRLVHGQGRRRLQRDGRDRRRRPGSRS